MLVFSGIIQWDVHSKRGRRVSDCRTFSIRRCVSYADINSSRVNIFWLKE